MFCKDLLINARSNGNHLRILVIVHYQNNPNTGLPEPESIIIMSEIIFVIFIKMKLYKTCILSINIKCKLYQITTFKHK